jgi:membrane protein DedA with SNARE-associated domain
MLQQLVEQYGYLAVFAGCFLEGETVLVLGGFAAYLGYLSLPGVIATATVGGFLGDEAWFLVGRRYGTRLLARFPKLRKARPYVRQKLDVYGHWVVFFVRFAIGLRVAGPIIIGASGMAPWRFTPPNAGGAFVWACVIGGAGYVFGGAFTVLMEHAKRYEHVAFVVVALIVLVAVAARGRWTAHLEARARSRAREGDRLDAIK